MVLEKANELGRALSESEEFTEMLRLRSELEADIQLQQAITGFSDTQQALMELMGDEDADQAEIKGLSAELERLQDELMGNQLFSSMLSAQNAFENLMKKVNSVIGSYIGGEEDDDDCCGDECGSCCSGGCEGCKH